MQENTQKKWNLSLCLGGSLLGERACGTFKKMGYKLGRSSQKIIYILF